MCFEYPYLQEQDEQGWELGDKGTGSGRAGYGKREVLIPCPPPPTIYRSHVMVQLVMCSIVKTL